MRPTSGGGNVAGRRAAVARDGDDEELVGAVGGLEAEALAGPGPGGVVDGHAVGGAAALDRARDARRVAECVCGVGAVTGGAGGDRQPRREGQAELALDDLARALERAQDLPAAAHGAQRVVGLRARVAEEDRDAVGDPRQHVAAQACGDLAADRVKARADDGARVGVERVQRGRVGQVAEQDGDVRVLAGRGRFGGGLRVLGDTGGRRRCRGRIGRRAVARDEHLAVVVGRFEHGDELLAQRGKRRVVEVELQAQGGVRHAPAARQQRERAFDDIPEGRHEIQGTGVFGGSRRLIDRQSARTAPK